MSARQWGTVREDYSADGDAWTYFPHDHARSRAYRWGEDGLAGISDAKQRLCFAWVFWNGRDPILKERLFGVTLLITGVLTAEAPAVAGTTSAPSATRTAAPRSFMRVRDRFSIAPGYRPGWGLLLALRRLRASPRCSQTANQDAPSAGCCCARLAALTARIPGAPANYLPNGFRYFARKA